MIFLNNHRTLRNLLIVGVIIAAGLLLRQPIGELSNYLLRNPAVLRPLGWIALLISSLILIVAARLALPVISKFWRTTSFWFVRRNFNWWLPLVSVIMLLILFLISNSNPSIGPFAGLTAAGVLPLLIPLMMGVQAATLLSLEDDHALELPLTCQRPFAWQVAEYALLTLILYLLLGAVGILIALPTAGSDFVALLLRWLPAAVLLWGLGLRVCIATRQIIFSVMIVLALWYLLLYFGQTILVQYPYLWLLHPFLQSAQLPLILPESSSADFLLNRALVTSLGVLFFVSALHQLTNEEWVLTGRYPLVLPKKLEVAGNVDVNR
ncbi:MAG: hypothetical protein U0528_19685 [Anaerolineae bacterium]